MDVLAAPRIASEQRWIDAVVPEWWHYTGAAGPIAAALVVAARTDGRAGLRTLFDQFRPRRALAGWLLFPAASPVVLLRRDRGMTRRGA
ncbi:MAG: hypothetical protein HYU37_20295 [Acidobacteria bacterium]|nr:hypothetical protein [Acidobacteriota bacterium]